MRTRQTWSAGSLHPGMTWPILALLATTWLGTFGCGGSMGRNLFGKKPESRSLTQIRPLAGDPEALLRNAHYFQLMGRPDLAVRELEEACRLAPHNLKVVNALARSYEELGKFEQARQVYQEALNRHGVHPGLQNNLCFSYYQEGRWKEAEACFRQALTRDPGNGAARNNLGLLLCRQGRPEEARRLWREAEGEAVAQAMLNQAREALGSPVTYAQASPAAGVPPSAAAATKSSPGPVQPSAKAPEPAPAPDPQVAAITPKPEKPAAPMAAKSPEAAAPDAPGDSPAPPAKTVFQEAAGSNKLTRPPVVNATKSSPGPVQPSAKAPEPAPAPDPQVAAITPKPEKPAAPMAAKSPEAAAPDAPGDSPAPPAKTVFQEAAGSNKLTRPPVVNAAKSSPGPVQSSAKLPEAAPAPAPSVVVMSPSPEKPAGLIAAKAPESAASEIPGDLPAPPAKAVSQAAAGSKKLTRPSVATAAKSSPGSVQSSAKFLEPAVGPAPPVAAAAPAPEKPAAPDLPHSRLTARELLNTRILVLNGAGIPKLAHLYRTLLSAEGFHVGRIGNHIDFGAENTTIYYLPEAEKVAQALQAELFPHSRMASKHKLPPGAQIKLVLGHDLEGQEKVFAIK